MKAKANDFVEDLEYELEALNLVKEADIDHLEAIMRTELGSHVSKMSSKELKRDAYRFAKNEPKLFIDLYSDEDIKLRNLANRAVEKRDNSFSRQQHYIQAQQWQEDCDYSFWTNTHTSILLNTLRLMKV